MEVGLSLAALGVAALVYAARARTLRRRGRSVPPARAVSFALGLGVLVVALVSPLASLAEERSLGAHMAQHLLLADLAPLALLAGLTGPLLRPLLAVRAVQSLRALAHPLVALPLWVSALTVWHLPPLYDLAVRDEVVHVAEHASFLAAGLLMWAPVVETLPAPVWFGSGAKLGYVLVVRFAGMVLGNVLLWSDHLLYAAYVHAHAPWGLTLLADQRLAGGAMMTEGSIVTLAALALYVRRFLDEAGRRQALVERGVHPAAAERAARFRRA